MTYVKHLNRVVHMHFARLRDKGVDVSQDEAEWDRALAALRTVFDSHDYPDLYLFRRWKTPIELGFISELSMDYVNETWFTSMPTEKMSRVNWDSIRPYIDPLDQILYHLAMFSGDHNAKDT